MILSDFPLHPAPEAPIALSAALNAITTRRAALSQATASRPAPTQQKAAPEGPTVLAGALNQKGSSKQLVFEPDWRVIESVARASKDASYRKPKFRRYLEEYSRDGLFCRRGKVLTPRRKAYYEGIRRRKIECFIQQNRKLLLKEANDSPKGESLLQNIRNMTKTNL